MRPSVLILVYNEERHIVRCIENALLLSKDIYVLDSGSNDRTKEYCNKYPVISYYNNSELNKFNVKLNWALDNINFQSDWVIRLDADELFSNDLIKEIHSLGVTEIQNITGFKIPKKSTFLKQELRFSRKLFTEIRLFKKTLYRYEDREIDEHLVYLGEDLPNEAKLKSKFIEDNIITIDQWYIKHLNYAMREATELEISRSGLHYKKLINKKKGILKKIYSKSPLFLRSFVYFFFMILYRPLFFLDGYKGLLYLVNHSLVYRLIVDTNCYKIRKKLCI